MEVMTLMKEKRQKDCLLMIPKALEAFGFLMNLWCFVGQLPTSQNSLQSPKHGKEWKHLQNSAQWYLAFTRSQASTADNEGSSLILPKKSFPYSTDLKTQLDLPQVLLWRNKEEKKNSLAKSLRQKHHNICLNLKDFESFNEPLAKKCGVIQKN